MITEAGVSPLIKSFKRKLYIDNPGNGIVVTIPLNSVGGKRSLEYILDGQTLNLQGRKRTAEKGGRMSVNTDFELIFVIANEGYTDMIMDAARSAGATGGTVVKPREPAPTTPKNSSVFPSPARRRST